MADKALAFIAFVVFLFVADSCVRNRMEVRKLNFKILMMKKDIPDDLLNACERAVDMTCNLQECSTVSIEELQERICVPEEQ